MSENTVDSTKFFANLSELDPFVTLATAERYQQSPIEERQLFMNPDCEFNRVMAEQRLTYDDIKGVYALMPTPATPNADDPQARFTVDLEETERGAQQLVRDDVDAILLNGTVGEASTLTKDEWKQFTKRVVDTVDGEIPVLAGATTLNTRDTIERAKYARDIGADGLLLGRPMWAEMSPDVTYEYYRDVGEAVPELGIVVYHNPSAFKNEISADLWKRLATIPQVVGSKYGPIDDRFVETFEAVKGDLRMMTHDEHWPEAYERFPEEAVAGWSGNAPAGPLPLTRLRDLLFEGDMAAAKELAEKIEWATEEYLPEGNIEIKRLHIIPLAKLRYTTAGYINAGPPRPPYHLLPEKYEENATTTGRRWRELVDELEENEL